MKTASLTLLLPCILAAAPLPRVTFTKDVAPILNRRCVECHRPGEVAPMSLLSYKDTRPWAKAIKEAVRQRSMPPWLADPRYGKEVRWGPQTWEEMMIGWFDYTIESPAQEVSNATRP